VHRELVIAGFGGQGIAFMGELLATAGMIEGRHVVWNPSYGPEMRGGESNCTVIVSSDPIGSPVVSQPDAAVIMDQPSLGKWAPKVRGEGLLFVNSSLVKEPPPRDDLRTVAVPATALAEELGSPHIANVVMLGAVLEVDPMVTAESVIKALPRVMPARRHRLIPLNEQALRRGAEHVRSGAASPAAAP
jgi:2-oxoglutarate ferredoxin oxidoreductase subunit gamma